MWMVNDMSPIDRIIFVGQTGSCREPMAVGIMSEFPLKFPCEVVARGLVVQFPEPMNQKVEAVLISNGVNMPHFEAKQLTEADFTDNMLILTMEMSQRDKVLELFPQILPDRVFAIHDFVGEELEILDPYGGNLTSYGLCYETMRKSLKKFVKMINEGE